MRPAFNVSRPGLLTTLQDLGRPDARRFGVSTGGVMDRYAHVAANRLVGNPDGSATLEITLRGPELVALEDSTVAVTGADLGFSIDGSASPQWKSTRVRAGEHLTFSRRYWGARSYLAIAGGFTADVWLGSSSTDLLVARGGLGGRALRSADVLYAESDRARGGQTAEWHGDAMPAYPADREARLRVVPGPHSACLGEDGARVLTARRFTVSTAANRMGYRLDGPALAVSGAEILSIGLLPGCIQVPWGGQPILLMADHQTAGGYPVVAAVIAADLPAAAQLLPGDAVSFAIEDTRPT